MLKNLPSEFQCILDLQETSVRHDEWVRANLCNCYSANGGGQPQRHGLRDNRISQQCSRNNFAVGTTDYNPRSWRWCCSGVVHALESSVGAPQWTPFIGILMAQAYRWPDLGLLSSPVTSLAVVKAQWPICVS